jgi:hypothetical protein
MAIVNKLCLTAAVTLLCALATNWTYAGETTNRLSVNRLSINRLSINRLAVNRLAVNDLSEGATSSTRLKANQATADFLATEDGRDVYAYLISCALPAGTTIEATVAGAQDSAPPETLYSCSNEICVFEGSIGLAEYWIDHRLAPKEQRWVSACVFARVNAHDISQEISLRGPNDNLAVSANEAKEFPLQEGAFYGNLFTGNDPIDWNACRGEDQAVGESGGLVNRDCAEPDPYDPTHTVCGFNYAGDCANFMSVYPAQYACKSIDEELGGAYTDCHATAGDGHWPSSKAYREVITTYVRNSP